MYHDFHTSPITSMIIVCTDEQFSEDINNHMIVTASHKELIAWELNSSGPVELGVNVRISTEHNGTINVSDNKYALLVYMYLSCCVLHAWT